MNYLDRIKWLNRARNNQKEIGELEREYRKARDQAERITARYSGSAGGGERDPHKFDRVAEYTDLIRDSEAELYRIKAEILTAINGLESQTYRRLLRLRYLGGYSWVNIALKMNYSEPAVYTIHRKAVRALDIPEDYSQL